MARKLRPKLKEEIRQAFQVGYTGLLKAGVAPEQVIDQCAKHAIGLLEIEEEVAADWYEKESS